MTFTEHLAELRVRIIRSLWTVAIATVVAYYFSDRIFELVAGPLRPLQQAASSGSATPGTPAATPSSDTPAPRWTAMNFIEPFMVRLRLAMYFGVLIALPVIVYQLCAFVFPGLTPGERKLAKFLVFGSSTLAVCGVALAYFGVLPWILPYMMQWAPPWVEMQLRMSENISLILKLLLGFAIAFQFPMLVLIFVYLEILSPDVLKKYRRMAIVAIGVLSAVITPTGDPFTLGMLMIPLVLLYEVSIWGSYLVLRRKKKTVAAATP